MTISTETALMAGYIQSGLDVSGAKSVALGDPGHPSGSHEGERTAIIELQEVCEVFINKIPTNWPNGEAPYGRTLACGDFLYVLCPEYLAPIVDNCHHSDWYRLFVDTVNQQRLLNKPTSPEITPANHRDDVRDAAMLTAFIAVELQALVDRNSDKTLTTPAKLLDVADEMGHIEIMQHLYDASLKLISTREWDWCGDREDIPTVEFVDMMYSYTSMVANEMAENRQLTTPDVMRSLLENYLEHPTSY